MKTRRAASDWIALRYPATCQYVQSCSQSELPQSFSLCMVDFKRPDPFAFFLTPLPFSGLLASVVTFSVRSYLIRSKQNVAKLEISKMMQALETFYATYDRFPTNEEGLGILAAQSDEFSDGLLSFIPTDPWGHDYEYLSPGRNREFDIICYGADHREGGTGADADLRSDEIMQRSRR